MSNYQERFPYRREQKIQISTEEGNKELLLIAPSARKTEIAAIEAQEVYQEGLAILLKNKKSLEELYNLQDDEVLIEACLEAEWASLAEKAKLTLVEKDEEYEAKLTEKTQKLAEKRKEELKLLAKEKLSEKLVGKEITRRVEALWQYANLTASLAQAVHNEKREPLFNDLKEMKSELSAEQIDELLEYWIQFISRRGNAQVFQEPCTSKG